MPTGVYPRLSGPAMRERLAIIRRAQAAPLPVKVAAAKRLIAELARPGTAAAKDHRQLVVLFSGGRDSCVVAALAQDAGAAPALLHCDTGLAAPGAALRVEAAARALGAPLHVVRPAEPAFEMWARLGHYPIGPKRGHTYLKRAVPGLRTSPVQCCYQLKERPARAWLREHRAAAILWGNRAADSDRRKLGLGDHGAVHEPSRRWPCTSAEPIAVWTDDDVRLYLAARLPGLHWESRAETGCRCCCTDLARPDNQLTRLYATDRAAFEEAMRSGLGAEILRANRRPETVEDALARAPYHFLRLVTRARAH